MSYILFDDPAIRENLLPLSFTRPVSLMRVGIMTIAEKWEKYLKTTVFYRTEPYLQDKFPLPSTYDNIFINGAIIPSTDLVKEIRKLKDGMTLTNGGGLIIAFRKEATSNVTPYTKETTIIKNLWDIFGYNGQEIRKDFTILTKGRKSAPIKDKFTKVYNRSQVFIEKGAKIYSAILNAENGPIYIGANTEIAEGSAIRGPFALCEGASLNMGAKMKEDTTIGPFCKAGGEVQNSVLFAYSNKSHDGFIGNTVLGEWCNLGAGATTSNLKNSYGPVRLYSYGEERFVNSEKQFIGLIMADHSKAAINTTFNTGTVVGVSANIFGSGFPGKFIPSFSWGGSEGYERYKLDKVYEVAERVMARRKKVFNDVEKKIIKHIFYET